MKKIEIAFFSILILFSLVVTGCKLSISNNQFSQLPKSIYAESGGGGVIYPQPWSIEIKS